MNPIQCALCGKEQKIKELYRKNFNLNKINPYIFSARRLPDKIHYRLVRCNNCGLIFSNPILPFKKISKLYARSTFDYNIESEFLKKTYSHYLESVLAGKRKQEIKLLDIGCGNGFFLEKAKDMGIGHVQGVEPGKASLRNARADIKKVIKVSNFHERLFPKESFDIICCFHTLDHVVDPNIFLKSAYGMLKKKGKIFFIVHNTNAFSVKLFGENSPIFDIEHIFLFNPKSLKKLFYKNGLTDLKIFNIKNTYPLNYWFKLFPMPSLFKENLIKLLNFTKIGLLPISLNAGNIGIVGSK